MYNQQLSITIWLVYPAQPSKIWEDLPRQQYYMKDLIVDSHRYNTTSEGFSENQSSVY